MARYDDLNTKTIGYLTFLSSILLVVIILLLQALTYNWIDWQEEDKLTKQSYRSSDELIQAQRDSLSGYAKVKVEVPVEPAKDGKAADGKTADGKAADGKAADGKTADGKKAAEPQTKTVERLHIPIERAKELVLEEFSKDSEPKDGATPST